MVRRGKAKGAAVAGCGREPVRRHQSVWGAGRGCGCAWWGGVCLLPLDTSSSLGKEGKERGAAAVLLGRGGGATRNQRRPCGCAGQGPRLVQRLWVPLGHGGTSGRGGRMFQSPKN